MKTISRYCPFKDYGSARKNLKVFSSLILSKGIGKIPWQPRYSAGAGGNFCHELETLPKYECPMSIKQYFTRPKKLV
jgi:hypothetical protein